jgi:ABC-2 type transport system ATP-binding protein
VWPRRKRPEAAADDATSLRASPTLDRVAASVPWPTTPDSPPALELRGLTKRYDDGTLALERFDLSVPAGRFFGLLGPNGAGKTTLISAVCNLIRITDGGVLVFGEPAHSLRARRWVGLAEQDVNLDRFLTVEEVLVYHGGYFGMSGPDARRRATEMIDVFDLRAKTDVRTPKLSGGMRRRLLLARALMHRPRLVILDEPTAGVDVELRHELWRYIRRLHAEGTTILLTTHYLEEAEELCEEIALIGGGQLIARDSAEGLRERFSAASLTEVYMKTVGAGRAAAGAATGNGGDPTEAAAGGRAR